MKAALLCSGLGHIHRGHEVFARDLHTLLRGRLDITLFKGGGPPAAGEVVVDALSRLSPLLADVHLPVSPRWMEAAREQERIRIEGETFAYAALKPLLEGGYDIVHCLEQEVCNVVFDNRHLFRRPPKVVFSNGGAIPAADLPRCDFVQEHTPYNLGTICHWHKRMDHVIRELAPLADVHLAIVGQEAPDSAAIKALGRELMGDRITFTTLPHDDLPMAYAAADVFVLGSLFETFGIVYIEAMAMGLPVVCTRHENQRSIVQQGIFVDMASQGALTAALRQRDPAHLARLGARGRQIVEREFDLAGLADRYLDAYRRIAAAPSSLPGYGWKTRLRANVANGLRSVWRTGRGWVAR